MRAPIAKGVFTVPAPATRVAVSTRSVRRIRTVPVTLPRIYSATSKPVHVGKKRVSPAPAWKMLIV